MNSVDTGWINDENPAHIAERLAAEHGEHGFATPLDEVDAAARVLDPVFTGVAEGNTASGARPAFSTPLPFSVLSTRAALVQLMYAEERGLLGATGLFLKDYAPTEW